jgi:predicted nucleic acid-binding protein
MDALIAAIALTHGAGIATRDTSDFADLGLDLINPFEASAID